MARRNICDVIGACCAIAPELTEPLNAIYQRAWFIAPEAQPSQLWSAAQAILAEWSRSGVPVETVDRVGRLWAGIDPLPSGDGGRS